MPGLLSLLPSRASDHLSYLCSVNFLDLSDPISVTYHRNTKGSYLLEHVSNSIDVAESDYFGLKYLDNHKLECWLDPTKSIYSQLKGVSNPVFHFRVKFYPANPDIVRDDVTRYQLYLQAYKDFEEGRLICTLRDALVLAAYIVQGELGDCSNVNATSFNTPTAPPNTAATTIITLATSTPTTATHTTATIITSTPKRSRNQAVDYVSETRLPESLRNFQDDIRQLHTKLKGMDQATCERHFLRKASSLNSYGMHPYVVADLKGNNLYLTLTPKGIVVFEDNVAISQYKWQEVKKTTFDGKLFYVKTHVARTGDTSVEKEDGLKAEKEETRTVAYRSLSSKACKQLWKNSVAHKLFFTLTSSEQAPKVLHSGGMLSRGGKFRYSGRCLSEMNQLPTPKDEAKIGGTPVLKKYSGVVGKYATLPKGGDKMNTSCLSDDPYDASEDEKSLLNKTATSIVLNYLSTTTIEDDSPPRKPVRRSLTAKQSTISLSTGSGENNDNAVDNEGSEVDHADQGVDTASRDTTKQYNSLPLSCSATPTQHRSFSATFNHTTKAITAATNKLKRFLTHNTTKKTDHKKETKVVYRSKEEAQGVPVALDASNEQAVPSDLERRKSIFEDADLSHGVTATPSPPVHQISGVETTAATQCSTKPTINLSTHPSNHISTHLSNHISTHPSTKAPTHPSTLPLNSTDRQGFIDKLKESDSVQGKHLPTTLNTSTIVTTIQTTHSSIHRNNYDPNNKVITSNDRHERSHNNNNYFNDAVHFVDETIHKTERISENKIPKKTNSVDSNRNIVHDANDTGYLSGSDAFNQSFEGQRASNIREFFNKKDESEDLQETSEVTSSRLTLTNSNEQISKRGGGSKSSLVGNKNSREELLDLLTYESSLMHEDNTSNHCNNNTQARNKEHNTVNNETTNVKIEVTDEGGKCVRDIEDNQKHSSVEDIFFNVPSLPDLSDLSPSTLSSASTKGSTVRTPDADECGMPEDVAVSKVTTISSIVEQAAPGINSMGVLSDDNFERIKEIRKLLQENKEKIQEIRENIDSEIRTFAVGSSRDDLPPNYKFCYEDGAHDGVVEDAVCGDVGDSQDNRQHHSDDEDYAKFKADRTADDGGGVIRDDQEDERDYEGEETIFIDRNYNTGMNNSNDDNNRNHEGSPQRVSKPKHIAFSTKHYEWYGENGISSGGGGVIYTFCGGPVGIADGKYPSDCGLVKHSPIQEERSIKDDVGRREVKSPRKASIGRSISSIEGIYSADNVHHYNPNFDKEEVINEAFMGFGEFDPVAVVFEKICSEEEGAFDPMVNERVVIGGRDITETRDNKLPKDDDFITSKTHDLTKSKSNPTPSKKANVPPKVESPKMRAQVTFSDTSSEYLQGGSPTKQISFESIPQLATLKHDVLTFDKLLQESEANLETPFCKFLTEKPEASKTKSDFDGLNAQEVSGTYSARHFASDMDDLDRGTVEEDTIVAKVSALLYEDAAQNDKSSLEVKQEVENEPTSVTNETKPSSIETETKPKDSRRTDEPKKGGRSCMGTLLTSSIIAIALFSVAVVILFETNKDKDLFSGFGPIGDFRSSIYEPYKHYVVCSIRKHLPKDFFGVE